MHELGDSDDRPELVEVMQAPIPQQDVPDDLDGPPYFFLYGGQTVGKKSIPKCRYTAHCSGRASLSAEDPAWCRSGPEAIEEAV